MSKKESSKIDVSILEIREIYPKKQTINNPSAYSPNDTVTADFSVGLHALYNLEDNVIKIGLDVKIGLEVGNEHFSDTGEFSYDFIYSYRDLKTLLDSDGQLTPEIFVVCASISYSTLRGIILTKASGSSIENILLPVVTGTELLQSLKKGSKQND